MTEFAPFPKIARLNRNITITEKIDGTNAAVVIVEQPFGGGTYPDYNGIAIVVKDDLDDAEVDSMGHPFFEYHVYAQSRTRFITPGKNNDNYGFAAWVRANAEALVETLGEGTHYGEWWGAGIQRKYGLTGNDKRFSLFNTTRWAQAEEDVRDLGQIPGLGVVPVLYEGQWCREAIDEALARLDKKGSHAVDFENPEGIVIFHHASRDRYKVTLKGDADPKGQAAHANDEEKRVA